MKDEIMDIFTKLQQLEMDSDRERLCDVFFQAQSVLLEALDLVEQEEDDYLC